MLAEDELITTTRKDLDKLRNLLRDGNVVARLPEKKSKQLDVTTSFMNTTVQKKKKNHKLITRTEEKYSTVGSLYVTPSQHAPASSNSHNENKDFKILPHQLTQHTQNNINRCTSHAHITHHTTHTKDKTQIAGLPTPTTLQLTA